MKKTIIIILISFLETLANAQTSKEMLAELQGKWQLDDNRNVTFVKIVEVPELNKDEIYNRALNYFTYNYASGKFEIQNQDKESGIIVGKGIYDNVHVGISILITHIDTWHILRVDIKNGRARIIVTLTDYNKKVVMGNEPPLYLTTKVSYEYPISKNSSQKTVMLKAFYKSYKCAIKSLVAVEKAIKEGNTSKAIENSNW